MNSLHAQKKYSVHLSGHYGFHFETAEEEGSEDQSGRIGYGVEFRYYLGSQQKKVNTAIGISYSRFGFNRDFQWTEATPELEERFGKFPITYEMWDDFHYISFPFYLNYTSESDWALRLSGFLDYPIGTGYYRNRSSADGLVIETYSESFNSTKAYPFNTSIGASMIIGKSFALGDEISLIIESQFKVYTLLAFRSNDYFPHEEYLRPYTIGLSAGIQF